MISERLLFTTTIRQSLENILQWIMAGKTKDCKEFLRRLEAWPAKSQVLQRRHGNTWKTSLHWATAVKSKDFRQLLKKMPEWVKFYNDDTAKPGRYHLNGQRPWKLNTLDIFWRSCQHDQWYIKFYNDDTVNPGRNRFKLRITAANVKLQKERFNKHPFLSIISWTTKDRKLEIWKNIWTKKVPTNFTSCTIRT